MFSKASGSLTSRITPATKHNNLYITNIHLIHEQTSPNTSETSRKTYQQPGNLIEPPPQQQQSPDRGTINMSVPNSIPKDRHSWSRPGSGAERPAGRVMGSTGECRTTSRSISRMPCASASRSCRSKMAGLVVKNISVPSSRGPALRVQLLLILLRVRISSLSQFTVSPLETWR